MTVATTDATEVKELASRMRESRARATRWLLDHIDDDGTPAGAAVRNGWARVPWALALVGEREAGAAVVSWAEQNALDDEFDFREGPSRSQWGAAYQLAHLAYGAWLLERYDTALGLINRLRAYQNPETGGVTRDRPGGDSTQDFLLTGQLGATALITQQRDVADGVYRFISMVIDAQPELPDRLYTGWNDGLVTEFAPEAAFLSVVEFQKERQAYFNPGMAAVFLAGYTMQTGNKDALSLGQRLLQLNIDGTSRQFDDVESVQICKFGWGAAAMMEAERTDRYLPHVVRMAKWFMERQAAHGTWAPSSFLSPEPDDIDKMVKTAEHLMEFTVIATALAGRRVAAQ